MSGPTTPFWNRGGGFGITGSPSAGWTFTKTAEASTAETIATFKVGDDATSKLEVMSGSTTDAQFVPMLRGTSPSTAIAFIQRAVGTTDSGTSSLMFWDTRIGASTAVATRPLYTWANGGAAVLSLLPLSSGANSALSWGTQSAAAPAFTTRSAGTRAVWSNSLSASAADYATGVESGYLWNSVATTTAAGGFKWYAGITNIASLSGNGLLTTTGGRVKKYRIALTSPVTIAVTDDIVEINLTTPGAVTINYPASPETGREYTTIDGKGDAGANNHTHTPAAGNINGAATVVVATNYYRRTAAYNGTQWLIA